MRPIPLPDNRDSTPIGQVYSEFGFTLKAIDKAPGDGKYAHQLRLISH